MFMKIDGASGESKDSNHQGWSDIVSFSWGATQPGTMATGGGGGAGKASFNDLHVVAQMDKASPAVMKHCASGKHLNQVQLSVCKAGGTQIEYSRITLTDVMVTSVQHSADNTGTTSASTGSSTNAEAVTVNYAFQAAQVMHQYWEQTSSGGKGAESQVSWDIKQNKEA
jgi:type VI secretion system secreted protein Hcp